MEPFKIGGRNDAKAPSLFLLQAWMERTPGLTAGITGREGGVSGEPWQSLNCALHVGDADESVIRNRRSVAEAAGWPFEAWTCGEQVHGDAVYQVDRADKGRGRESRFDAFQNTDALMTNVPGVLLTSFYADCVPLFFLDPGRRAVALAHAGWKGTVAEIARKTVEAMTEAYGSEPSGLLGAIGPSIGECCYEVDGPVIAKVTPLAESLAEAAGVRRHTMVAPRPGGKAMLNLKEINRQIMIKAGILPMNIELTEICTGCRLESFFSHRMENGAAGRMASFIGFQER
ncbi:multicopper polyphenol oxidase [Paenibacillus darwinianus]|uniref:Purine nucleoside phosphorylase n=1 Tax=Paenibacillus darwinianus TaxID=1380763 RepID=A0A9W5S4B3_9BACL|nr:peptidoglycan editing factor PgeF [Paenibacillus darwinianus]EXX91702.1 multicopper polyphenol oxidase [Paenibacillus darwinianus]EXX92582.1 multicopper polyphenol oxidase [Paenibacillus darwinianus]EXX92694.1 multicopper polyphenol oxidase [Paenibacillus darwinianus]